MDPAVPEAPGGAWQAMTGPVRPFDGFAVFSPDVFPHDGFSRFFAFLRVLSRLFAFFAMSPSPHDSRRDVDLIFHSIVDSESFCSFPTSSMLLEALRGSGRCF